MTSSGFSARRLFVGGLLLCIVAGWTFYFFGLEGFLEAAYSGDSFSYFNEYASRWKNRQTDPGFQTFRREAQTLLFRFGLMGTGIVGLLVGVWLLRPRLLTGYFFAETSPFNLALFRIILFGVLLAFDLGNPEWYARLPDTLRLPPRGLSWVSSILPIDPSSVSWVTIIFRGACIFGLLGLYTRTMALVTLVTGVYVLGVPQLYGKINHYHHVLWFTALLVPSRCADVLSLDAVRQTRQSATADSPGPARTYALPLRYAWLLLGLVYFFPGMWKFASEGVAWAFSDNLKYRMHTAWFSRPYTPFVRLDQFPLLYQGAGAFTLMFEIGFLFTLPFRSLRAWAVGAAYVFHEATRWFLAITFWTLYPLLPFLLDVRGFFVRLGKMFFPEPLVLAYTPTSVWQRSVVGSLLRMDVFDRLRTQEADAESNGNGTAGGLAVSASAPGEDALWINGTFRIGPGLRILRHVPVALLLFPLVPFARRETPSTSTRSYLPASTFSVTVLGGVLVGANLVCGVAKINSYPFSVYPTFAVRADSTVTTLRIEGTDAAGTPREVLSGDQPLEQAGFSAARFRGLVRSILRVRDSTDRRQKLRALWEVLRDRRSDLDSITTVRFYEATYHTDPDRTADRLLSESLLTTLELSPPISSSSRQRPSGGHLRIWQTDAHRAGGWGREVREGLPRGPRVGPLWNRKLRPQP